MNKNFNYVKNKNGETKSAYVKSDEVPLEDFKKLSKDLEYIIYSIPKETEVEFNDKGWLIKATGNTKDIWQFYNGWAMPYECFINGFPFPVKMEEMWGSDKEVEEVDIEELRWNLKYPWWSTAEQIPYNLSPQEVLEEINRYKDHKERIDNAETDYPLLLVETKQNRWLIYDGVHRFVKEILERKNKVMCKKFRIEEIDDYINDQDRAKFEEWKELYYFNSYLK